MTAADGAARRRVATVLDQLARVDLNVVVVGRADATRRTARERARDAAMSAGRGGLLAEATSEARALALRSFARNGFNGTWAVADWSISVASARDRAGAAEAFDEAVTAAVAEDLVDVATLDVLRATADDLIATKGLPSPGALSELARGPVPAPAMAVLFVAGVLSGLAIGSLPGMILGVVVASLVVRHFTRNASGSADR